MRWSNAAVRGGRTSGARGISRRGVGAALAGIAPVAVDAAGPLIREPVVVFPASERLVRSFDLLIEAFAEVTAEYPEAWDPLLLAVGVPIIGRR